MFVRGRIWGSCADGPDENGGDFSVSEIYGSWSSDMGIK
jgi:hypothetical protein